MTYLRKSAQFFYLMNMPGQPPLSLTFPFSRAARLADVAGLSDAGVVRRHNEDRYLIDKNLGLLAVADGMGGHQAGALASATALDVMRAALARMPAVVPLPDQDPDSTTVDARWEYADALRRAVRTANADLYATNRARGLVEGQGMGTTLTGFWWLPSQSVMVVFHVGDTRLYRYRSGNLTQLTRDHTAYQAALESSAVGAMPPRNVLLQAVGPASLVDPDIGLFDACAGDVLLLCSDGLHGWVPHGELEAAVAAASPLAAVCAKLVALAMAHGSRDNVTVVAACFGVEE
jgi:serine/threonine protein phosphatase PrpC